jgi:hypothetical protein
VLVGPSRIGEHSCHLPQARVGITSIQVVARQHTGQLFLCSGKAIVFHIKQAAQIDTIRPSSTVTTTESGREFSTPDTACERVVCGPARTCGLGCRLLLVVSIDDSLWQHLDHIPLLRVVFPQL